MFDVASLFVTEVWNYISNRSYSLFCFCSVLISCFLSKKNKKKFCRVGGILYHG